MTQVTPGQTDRVGAGIGDLLLGWVPTRLLLAGPGIILPIAAVKVFQHAH
ncbi:MAG TPA: hypothetical protein VMV78_10925 [Thiobacillus sp.]|jgi:hypothetical protein|nr:hypothetical protein [Thiobacillus sp.]